MTNFLLRFVVTCAFSAVVCANPTDASAATGEQELNFSNVQLKTIGSEFISSAAVKNLRITHSNVEKIEEHAFKNLAFLENLDLSDNKLAVENLFSFGEAPSLKMLVLDGNFFNYTPDEDATSESLSCPEDEYRSKSKNACASKYRKLKVPYVYPELSLLSLRNVGANSTSDVDWRAHFPKLEYLDLSENYFKANEDLLDSIPPTVAELELESCNLTSLNARQLSNVKKLNLRNNHFKELSIDNCDGENVLCLRNFGSLKFLHISNCSIEEISPNAFSEVSLSGLDLSYNKFKNIPQDLFNNTPSQNLTRLNLSGNYLSSFNFLTTLKELLSLTMNDMKNNDTDSLFNDIPAMPSLSILNLEKNELTSVPASFLSKFPNLEMLDLSFNSIKSLPSWESLRKLNYLQLTFNKIKSIQDLPLHNATSLKYLSLQQNPISSIKIVDVKYLPENLTIQFDYDWSL